MNKYDTSTQKMLLQNDNTVHCFNKLALTNNRCSDKRYLLVLKDAAIAAQEVLDETV